MIDTEAIRARSDAATPGPWERDWAFNTHFVVPANAARVSSDNVARLKPRQRADAEFIAHARTDLPNLLDVIAKLREVVGAVRALCDEIRADSIIGTSPVARLRLIGQVVDAVPRQDGGETLGLAEEVARLQAIVEAGPCEEIAASFFADDFHEHRCTKRATDHAWHDCACGASWTPVEVTTERPIPAPEPCPFDDCHTGPLGRDQLNDHIAREHPDARAGQSVLGGDDPREEAQ